MSKSHYEITMFLDVKYSLSKTERATIESQLTQHVGVTSAEFSYYVPRVLRVTYNRALTNVQNIRIAVDRLLPSNEFFSSIVGL